MLGSCRLRSGSKASTALEALTADCADESRRESAQTSNVDEGKDGAAEPVVTQVMFPDWLSRLWFELGKSVNL
jgi:hypothetical protein